MFGIGAQWIEIGNIGLDQIKLCAASFKRKTRNNGNPSIPY